MASVFYRLRIRNAADSADALIISSVRSGTNPYIVGPPSGDGQEVDLLTGAVRSGAYVIEVADVVTGTDGTGTIRLVTNQLEDAGCRQQLLSRRTFLEISTDGSTWPEVWQAGYLTNIRQTDAITYAFTVSDSRRIEQTHRAFTWGLNSQNPSDSERLLFPRRGCLLGGPVIGGFGFVPDSGGINVTLEGADSIGLHGLDRAVALRFVNGALPPDYAQVRQFSAFAPYANKVLAPFAAPTNQFLGFLADPVFNPLAFSTSRFPDVVGIFTDGTDTWTGTLLSFFPYQFSAGINLTGYYGVNELAPFIYIGLDADQPMLPADDTALTLRLVHREVSEASPLYLDDHPVDIAANLYRSVNLPVDATQQQAVKDALGPLTRLAARIQAPVNMGTFLRDSLFGPFGFSARVGSDGEMEFFLTRRKGTGTPALTISTDDIQGDTPPPAFDLDEATVVTSFVVEYQTLSPAITTDDTNTPPPPDGVIAAVSTVYAENGDTTTFSTREVGYKLPGFVHLDGGFQPDMGALISAIALEGFDRFGRGAPHYELPVIRGTSASAAQIGDEVLVDVSYVPNRNYRIGESTVGPRVAQVVRRDETPIGPVLKLVDSGPNLQVPTAPTITIAASTAINDRTTAQVTVTNAATLNAAGYGVVVEYAVGSSPTTNGSLFVQYAGGEVPTAAFALPGVTPGQTVWARARSVSPLLRASAWTAWASVSLGSWTAPSAVVATAPPFTSAIDVEWTNGSASDFVAVYRAPGSVAPSDWTPYLIRVLPPGSTTTTLRGHADGANLIVGVAHIDPLTRVTTAVATDTVTAGLIFGIGPTIGWATFISTYADAQYPSGVAIALWSRVDSAGQPDNRDYEIQRAPDVSGAAGTYATLAVVPPGTETFIDPLPVTAGTFWYRIRGVLANELNGEWFEVGSATPQAIPPNLPRPNRPVAFLNASIDITATDYIVTFEGQLDIKAYTGSGVDPLNEISPSPTSPWTIARPGVGLSFTRTLAASVGDDVKSFIFNVNGIADTPVVPTVGEIGVLKVDSTDFDVDWTASGMPMGVVYRIDWQITADGSGSGVVGSATDPETITATSLGSAPECAVTVTALTSGGSFITSGSFTGPMAL